MADKIYIIFNDSPRYINYRDTDMRFIRFENEQQETVEEPRPRMALSGQDGHYALGPFYETEAVEAKIERLIKAGDDLCEDVAGELGSQNEGVIAWEEAKK